MATALIIIDVQQGMFAYGDPHDGARVVERLAHVLKKARAAGAPIVFVQHDGGDGSPLARDSDGFAFHEALTPEPGEQVVIKRHCNAFQGTGLLERLQAARIDRVVIGGMQTEFCVDTAVRGAFERAIGVSLIADGHTTFDTPALTAADIIAHHNHTLQSGHFAELRMADSIEFDE